MKKTGFTLAEVLITLGIIGVVAALTAPQLIMSGRNEATCSKLSVAVSSLENAFTNAITTEDAAGLEDTSIWTNTGNIGKYLNIAGVDTSNNVITTKSGVTITISDKTVGRENNGVYTSGGSLTKKVGTVDIRTNPTAENPSNPGRNYFRFVVGTNGILYPVGGKDANVYDRSNYALYTSSGHCGAASNATVDLTCTARIIADGYKMNY